MPAFSRGVWIRLLVYPVLVMAMFGALRWLETASLFPAPTIPQAWLDQQARIQGATARTVTAEDGVPLYAWHIPAHGTRVLLWFDGNGASIGMRGQEFARFRELGLDVVQVNYRGYPGSGGAPSEAGLRMDARAAWSLAQELVPGAPIVLFGKSLGGGVAIGLAAERPAAALIVESTFSSAVRVGAEAFPFLPVQWVMANRFDSEALAARVTCPTLLLHGTEDEIVPVRHADTLAAAFPTPPRVIRTVGATHNDAILLDDEVWPVVAGWARGAP